MLDLDVIENLTIDFKLKGQEINMRMPSQKKLRNLALVTTSKKSSEKQEEEMYNLIADIMSDNLNGIKFTRADLQAMNVRTIKSLVEYIGEEIQNSKKK